MKEKKKITLGTVIASFLGALFWIVVALYHIQSLANTTALILMIGFSIKWSIDAIFKLLKFLKERKQVE